MRFRLERSCRGARGVALLRLLGALFSAAALLGCREARPRQVEVVLDPAARAEEFEGFGASINAWSPELRGYFDRPEFRRFFLQELGATVLRVELHGDAVPEKARPEELSFRDFVLDGPGERAAVYLRAAAGLARDSGGELRVIASVWSPPAWMKVNGSIGNRDANRRNYALSDVDLGLPVQDSRPAPVDADAHRRHVLDNKLRSDRYEHFARSLVEWARLYRSTGAPLYALSAQNEPRFSHWFGSCVYTPAELARVLEAVVTAFEREGEPLPRLFAPETMTHDSVGNRAYLDALSSSALLSGRIFALATHGYVDGYAEDRDPRSAARFAELAQGRAPALWITEGGTGGHDWPAALDGLGSSLTQALTLGHASLVTPWQVVDVGRTQHGLLPLSGPSKKTAVARQFFRFFRPGMVRIGVSPSSPDLRAVAMLKAPAAGGGREAAVVLINRAAIAHAVRLVSRGRGVEVISAVTTDGRRSFHALAKNELSALTLAPESITSVRVKL